MFDRLLKTRWRIIVQGTLIVAAPLLGLALFVYVDVTSELEKLSGEKRQALASTTSQILEEKLRGEISFGTAYSARYRLIQGVIDGDAREMRRHLQNLVEISQGMELAAIASPKGVLLEAYPPLPDLLGKDYSQRDWYRGVSHGWRPYISEFFLRGAKPQYNVFVIAVPVRSVGGNVIGILIMQPRADFIKNALDSISQAGGTTYLVDNKGTIIYHPALSRDKTVKISHFLHVQKVLKGLEGYEKALDPLNGKTVISAYHPVTLSGWGVVTERPVDEVLAPVKRVTRGIFFFTTVMLVIGAWFAWRRSELIYALKKTSDELHRSNAELKAMNEESQAMNEELQVMNEELQAQQEELAESNRQLVEVSRTKSDFLANMSHELRTPLNSVIGFSEVLQDQLFGPLNDKQQEYVGNILASGRHLLSLINDILDLAKVESGKMELELSAFPLRETLDDSLMMLREKALKEGVELQLEFAPDAEVSIAADQRKLKQVMFNLLSNAVKFTPAGGSVSVHVRRVSNCRGAMLAPGFSDQSDQGVCNTLLENDGDFIEISVEDTGIGIKEEEMPKLFQAFTQLESAFTKEHEGTGLGLALTRRLIELHGGRVWVKSEFGTGSRFSFTLPLTQAAGKESATNGPGPVCSTGAGATVLLIENDQHTLEVLENALQGRGYRLLTAGCGTDGIATARQESPDLIVLDLMMPGMNGFDVASQLWSENAAAVLPVLVLTSMELSNADRARLEGKVWRIAEKGSLSTHEFIGLVESALGQVQGGTK